MANEIVQITRPDPDAIQASIAEMLHASAEIIVANDDDYQDASGLLANVKAAFKRLDTERKRITAPLDDAKRSVMDLFRAPTDALAEAEKTIKRRMAAYALDKEHERRDREARLSVKLDTAVSLPDDKPKALGAAIRDNWTAEVLDFPALVRYAVANDAWEMLLPNTQHLNALAKLYKGELKVDGVKVHREKIISQRS